MSYYFATHTHTFNIQIKVNVVPYLSPLQLCMCLCKYHRAENCLSQRGHLNPFFWCICLTCLFSEDFVAKEREQIWQMCSMIASWIQIDFLTNATCHRVWQPTVRNVSMEMEVFSRGEIQHAVGWVIEMSLPITFLNTHGAALEICWPIFLYGWFSYQEMKWFAPYPCIKINWKVSILCQELIEPSGCII